MPAISPSPMASMAGMGALNAPMRKSATLMTCFMRAAPHPAASTPLRALVKELRAGRALSINPAANSIVFEPIAERLSPRLSRAPALRSMTLGRSPS